MISEVGKLRCYTSNKLWGGRIFNLMIFMTQEEKQIPKLILDAEYLSKIFEQRIRDIDRQVMVLKEEIYKSKKKRR